jgi:peptide deformylase
MMRRPVGCGVCFPVVAHRGWGVGGEPVLCIRIVNAMEKLNLRIYGDTVLRRRAEEVNEFDEGLERLAHGMIDIMKNERGIGLAAPQVGVSKRMIVALRMTDNDDTSALPIVLVNPRITAVSQATWAFEEGCLSVPGITADVIRPEEIDVTYQDLSGDEHQLTATDIFGRILLHEIDHLDGKLFIDYLSSAKKSLIKSKLKGLNSADKHLF